MTTSRHGKQHQSPIKSYIDHKYPFLNGSFVKQLFTWSKSAIWGHLPLFILVWEATVLTQVEALICCKTLHQTADRSTFRLNHRNGTESLEGNGGKLFSTFSTFSKKCSHMSERVNITFTWRYFSKRRQVLNVPKDVFVCVPLVAWFSEYCRYHHCLATGPRSISNFSSAVRKTSKISCRIQLYETRYKFENTYLFIISIFHRTIVKSLKLGYIS